MTLQNVKKMLLGMSIVLLSSTTNAQTQLGADIDGEGFNDQSGYSVSMPDSYTVAIGARYNYGNGAQAGHVRIYSWNGVGWVQKGDDIDGEAAGDYCGISVSMPDSNTVAIGASSNGGAAVNAGHVRIFKWNGTAWTQKGLDIDGEAASDVSGRSVSMPDSNTVAIGAPKNDGLASNAGHVRIYTWNGTSWIQKGIDIDGEAANDESGTSVSMPDANTVAVGAPYNDGIVSNAGHVRVYSWNGNAWVQKGADLDGEGATDEFGFATSMPDANTVAVGGPRNDGNGSLSGHVRVYKWNGSAWIQQGSDIDGEEYSDNSGRSVSMPNPNTVAIGAPGNNGNLILDVGHVRIYDWNGTTWVQRGSDIDGEAASDYSGHSVSMPNDSTVAIGARSNDGTASNAGHVRVYYICPTDSIHEVAACGSYTWNGVTYTSSNNSATDTIFNSAGCEQIITLNLTINTTVYGTETVTACNSFTWIDGNTYTSSNNSATHTLTSAAGCDSVVSLNLTINTVNTAVSQFDALLTADEPVAVYQWLECPAMTPINGASDQMYTATTNGDYAVIVTANGCSDTSTCYTVNNAGIIKNDFGSALLIYPNPTNGEFSIDLGANSPVVTITMKDLNGKLIQSKTYMNEQLLNLKVEESTGVYLLEIESEGKKAVVRLIKE